MPGSSNAGETGGTLTSPLCSRCRGGIGEVQCIGSRETVHAAPICRQGFAAVFEYRGLLKDENVATGPVTRSFASSI